MRQRCDSLSRRGKTAPNVPSWEESLARYACKSIDSMSFLLNFLFSLSVRSGAVSSHVQLTFEEVRLCDTGRNRKTGRERRGEGEREAEGEKKERREREGGREGEGGGGRQRERRKGERGEERSGWEGESRGTET